MKNLFIFIFFSVVVSNRLLAVERLFMPNGEFPKYEVRAVWLTTIGGLDWPHSFAHDGLGIEAQQRELCNILDSYVEAGFNTVLLQTRVRGTVIYPSQLEPWEGSVSGQPGRSPGYDPLEYAVNECHRRGLKIHAWVVTIPLGKWNGAGCNNIKRLLPKLVKKVGGEGFMNPDVEGTGDYIARICKEITSRYDIDGIHLDYIRYPDAWGKISNRDKARNNITNIVKRVFDVVKTEKPWVVMSCSPVGKYADTRRARSRGWNARDAVCQDVDLWMKNGWMDMIFPMMYFNGDNFYPFVVDWKERCGDKTVVPGLGIYFMHKNEKNWPLDVITREMQVCRGLGLGSCFFRSKFFTDNTKGLFDYTKTSYSPYISLTSLKNNQQTGNIKQPYDLHFSKGNDGQIYLVWNCDELSNVENGTNTVSDSAVKYNVYGSCDEFVDCNDVRNLLLSEYSERSIKLPELGLVRNFAVTAIDRYGNESLPVRLRNQAGNTKNSVSDTTNNMLKCDGKYVYINDEDISCGDLIEIQTLQDGVSVVRIVRDIQGYKTVDVSSLRASHYKIYTVSRKGYKHLVGHFYRHL